MAMKAGVPGSLRRLVMREGGYCCCECGIVGFERRFTCGGYGYYTNKPGVYLSIDHSVARAKGGSNERDNLRVLCTTCNTRKGVKMLVAA